jgi:uncharacterized membrane protein
MAAKLARLVYRMLRYEMKYVDKGAATYQAQHRAATDQAAQVESRHPGIPTDRTSSGLKSTSFWGDVAGLISLNPFGAKFTARRSVMLSSCLASSGGTHRFQRAA